MLHRAAIHFIWLQAKRDSVLACKAKPRCGLLPVILGLRGVVNYYISDLTHLIAPVPRVFIIPTFSFFQMGRSYVEKLSHWAYARRFCLSPHNLLIGFVSSSYPFGFSRESPNLKGEMLQPQQSSEGQPSNMFPAVICNRIVSTIHKIISYPQDQI